MDEYIKIANITSDSNQRHTIEMDGGNVILVLRFHVQIQQWTADITRNEKSVYGVKLATGVKHIPSMNMGVDLAVVADENIDPFKADDFESGRCNLLMVKYVI